MGRVGVGGRGTGRTVRPLFRTVVWWTTIGKGIRVEVVHVPPRVMVFVLVEHFVPMGTIVGAERALGLLTCQPLRKLLCVLPLHEVQRAAGGDGDTGGGWRRWRQNDDECVGERAQRGGFATARVTTGVDLVQVCGWKPEDCIMIQGSSGENFLGNEVGEMVCATTSS